MRNLEVSLAIETDQAETALNFAQNVHDLTTSHFVKISCDQIEQLKQGPQVSFVYYGSVESMIDGEPMAHLHSVASFDRYHNQYELINFYMNDDPECKVKHNFTTFEPAIAMYVHPEVIPFTLQAPADEL